MSIDEMTNVVHEVRDVLERIARAQEGMLAIAAEARQERLKLSAQMSAALKRPMEERNESSTTPKETK